jgi:hypothetical protein
VDDQYFNLLILEDIILNKYDAKVIKSNSGQEAISKVIE